MDYNAVRELIARWGSGDTTLAQEAALRDFFAEAGAGLPVDLQPYRVLFNRLGPREAKSVGKLILHTAPKRRPITWLVAATAAAVAALTLILTIPARQERNEIICTVNGERITDPAMIAFYTREALGLVSDNLSRPAASIDSSIGHSAALNRAMEILETITINNNEQ